MFNRVVWVLTAILSVASFASAQDASTFNAQGVAHYEAGRWKEALTCFENAYELAPDQQVVRRNLCNAHQSAANALASEADYRAAAKHLETAISADPENPSPLMQLGFYYLRLEMTGDAIFRLEEAIDLAPENLDAHELLGDAYYKDNDLAAAQVQWEWVYGVSPDRPGLRDKLDKASREESVEQNFRSSDSRHFKLSFPPDAAQGALRKVLSVLEHAYIEVGRKFGGEYPPSTVQVIVYGNQEFTDATLLGEHVGGLFDGKIRIPLNDAAGNALDDAELQRRLYHEYTHVLVRFLCADNVPWWLNEGLAETFSRDYGPATTDPLVTALQEGRLFSLKDLEGTQLQRLDVDQLRLAYCQSHATVYYLWTKFGQRKLRVLLSLLAEGKTPDDALGQVIRRDYAKLEREIELSLK